MEIGNIATIIYDLINWTYCKWCFTQAKFDTLANTHQYIMHVWIDAAQCLAFWFGRCLQM